MEISELRDVANDLPFLKTGEEREKLLGVVGALVLRRISLARAAEIMGMQREALQTILDALAVNYSFLESADVETEKSWT